MLIVGNCIGTSSGDCAIFGMRARLLKLAMLGVSASAIVASTPALADCSDVAPNTRTCTGTTGPVSAGARTYSATQSPSYLNIIDGETSASSITASAASAGSQLNVYMDASSSISTTTGVGLYVPITSGNFTTTTLLGTGINGSVSSPDWYGVDVRQNYAGGSIQFVQGSGSTFSGTIGLVIQNFGGGGMDVALNGNSTGSTGPGVDLRSSGFGNITFNASGRLAGTTGLYMSNGGSGATQVTLSGSVVGTSSRGAQISQTGSGNVNVNSSGTISAAFDSLYVSGRADISVVTTGPQISSSAGTAIRIDNIGGTSITLNSASALLGETGIWTTVSGSAATDISVTGAINSRGAGIIANGNAGNVKVTAGKITSATSNGIDAYTQGAISIIANGDVTAERLGIAANVTSTNSTGALSIAVNGSVTSNALNAIYARHWGSGSVSVTTAGALVSSTSSTAIQVSSGNGGDVSVTANGARVSSANGTGIYAFSNLTGNVTVANASAINAGNGITANATGSGNAVVASRGDITSSGASIYTQTISGLSNINVTGGTVYSARSNALYASTSGGGNATINIAGGAVSNGNTTSSAVNATTSSGGNALINISGGSISSANGSAANASANNGGDATIVFAAGATANVSNGNSPALSAIARAGDATITSSGDVTSSYQSLYAQAGGGFANINIAGGTINSANGYTAFAYADSGGNSLVNVTGGSISSTKSTGAIAYAINGGNATINLTANATANVGDGNAAALYAYANMGVATVNSSGIIENGGIVVFGGTNGSAVTNITGGRVKSTIGYAVITNSSTSTSVNLSGGAEVINTDAAGAGIYAIARTAGNVAITTASGTKITSAGLGIKSSAENSISANLQGAIASAGDAGDAVYLRSTGNGSITVTSGGAITAAGTGDGFDIQSGGSISLVSSSAVTAGGAGIRTDSTGASATTISSTGNVAAGNAAAIQASGSSGTISISARNLSSSGSNAISATSGNGSNIAINIADGSTVAAGGGAGIFVNTSGGATISLGATATNATLTGSLAGINSTASGGQTLVLSGTVSAASNAAIILGGGAASLTNNGTINGFLTLAGSSNTFTNPGTWNAFGGTSNFSGPSSLINSGTIAVAPASTSAQNLAVAGLNSFANSGTVTLANSHTGDILNIGASSFNGSGASRLVLDANLGTATVGSSVAQTADRLVTTGASSGTTVIVINDLAASQIGQFNVDGIRLVTNGSSSSSSYSLQGGTITKGFVQYSLVQDAASNWNLVGLPSQAGLQFVRTISQAQAFWRLSGDAWAEQIRINGLKRGSSWWMQGYTGDQTDRSSPMHRYTIGSAAVNFGAKLDLRNKWSGVNFGYQLGRENWAVGLTGGYGEQTGTFSQTAGSIRVEGGNLGAYLKLSGRSGLFVNLLVKADRFKIQSSFAGLAGVPVTHGTTVGTSMEMGTVLRRKAWFVEPTVGLQATVTSIDSLSMASGGMGVKFLDGGSAFARAGLRTGIEKQADGATVRAYLGARWEGELADPGRIGMSSGTTGFDFADAKGKGRARLEAGVERVNDNGFAMFAKADVYEGKTVSGSGLRVGLNFRW